MLQILMGHRSLYNLWTLANGATTIMFEGIPNYPDTSRWWQIVDKYKVNTLYSTYCNKTLMREGDNPVKKTSRKSLKLLGTVGEQLIPKHGCGILKLLKLRVDCRYMVETETGGMCSPQTDMIPQNQVLPQNHSMVSNLQL